MLLRVSVALGRTAPGCRLSELGQPTSLSKNGNRHFDPNPQKAGEITRWTKGYWEAVHPYSADGAYVNFMMDDGDDSRLKATYGDNYERLVALKAKYDPTNFFR